jgi:hypothetical protein
MTESLRSPCGVLDQSWWDCMGTPGKIPSLWGLYKESLGTPCGLPIKSLRSPWGVLGESLGSGRTSAILGLVHMYSLGTP